MNTYERHQIEMAIKACRGDHILRTICMWCKNALGKYENKNGLGFCYVCRRMLFPESFARPKRDSNNSSSVSTESTFFMKRPKAARPEEGHRPERRFKAKNPGS